MIGLESLVLDQIGRAKVEQKILQLNFNIRFVTYVDKSLYIDFGKYIPKHIVHAN